MSNQITDTDRLNFLQLNPALTLRCHKKRWSLVGLTNYEYEVFKTVREAIDDAIAKKVAVAQ